MNLKLINFRNFLNKEISWTNNIFLIYGKNGSGKTSILEAIYFLARAKSFRTTNNKNLINKQALFTTINFDLETSIIKGLISKEGNNFIVDDQEVKNKQIRVLLETFILDSKTIVLVQNSKHERKLFFDKLFSRLNPSYEVILKKWQVKKTLVNQLLEKGQIKHLNFEKHLNEINELEKTLNLLRTKLVLEINQKMEAIFDNFSVKFIFNIDYNLIKHTQNGNKYNYDDFSKENYDYIFLVNKINSFLYSSEGINKLIVISVFSIFAKIYEEKYNKPVILLFDDIFSHIDDKNKDIILELLNIIKLKSILTEQNNYSHKYVEALELR